MTLTQRIHKIRKLQLLIDSRKRKHGSRAKLRRKLTLLVAQHLRWEIKDERKGLRQSAPHC